ncbi:scaffolding protein [Mycobacterium phage TM4]|uniref:Scaffolding protein n=1 Tax=Mycobacterium phage TM4 TaxID=88870 RepID=Q9ZX69_BPMT4|nr:head scaffolding protein [Mycobacterium phage TM4]AAD17576.1 scaffolding protein [Mycobacterium phage TM4]AGK85753.1 hypothetical protein 33D_0071 [Mycobacterium phage 33D]
MAEQTESTTETTEGKPAEDNSTEGADGGQSGDQGKTFTQAELDKVIEQRLARERAKFGDYDQLKADAAELAKIRDGEKSELQKALERAEQAEKRAEQAEFTSLRSKVAAVKGVPASSLTGKTEDELNASADELIAWRDQNKPPAPPKRNPAQGGGGLKSGATGNGNTNSDPKAAAAEALRRLRAGG